MLPEKKARQRFPLMPACCSFRCTNTSQVGKDARRVGAGLAMPGPALGGRPITVCIALLLRALLGAGELPVESLLGRCYLHTVRCSVSTQMLLWVFLRGA
jgi:hypothetical protein